MRIRKDLNLKILSLLACVLFLFNNLLYASPAPFFQEQALRIPMNGYKAVGKALESEGKIHKTAKEIVRDNEIKLVNNDGVFKTKIRTKHFKVKMQLYAIPEISMGCENSKVSSDFKKFGSPVRIISNR